jgi:hypothetical protein
MRCKKIKRWISDDLDGALKPGRKKRLAEHLASCPACQTYKRGLEALQAAVQNAAGPAPSLEYWPNALGRLAERIREAPGPERVRPAPALFPHVRWALAGAASLLVAAAVLYFALTPARVEREALPAGFEEGWSALNRELSDNPELARAFAFSLRSALNEPLREIQGEVVPLIDGHALFLEDLSDEEVLLLNAELAKEISN